MGHSRRVLIEDMDLSNNLSEQADVNVVLHTQVGDQGTAEAFGELLARNRTGQALSRLLNVADGLIGQAHKTLICITTNEPMDALHPAVKRPGRCLANLEFPALSRSEAAAWLGPDLDPPASGATLAELLVLRDELQAPPTVAEEIAPTAGAYL